MDPEFSRSVFTARHETGQMAVRSPTIRPALLSLQPIFIIEVRLEPIITG